MSCIVIGSGLAGLSVSYFLKKCGYEVKIISSSKKPGASNIFVGILYRYPGRWGKKSKFADEAFLMSRELIDEVEVKTKRKVIISTGVIKRFSKRLKRFSDVKMDGDDAYIDDAVTIDMFQYIEGLKDLIGRDCFIDREIDSLEDMKGIKVVAAGYGMKKLLPINKLIYRKGQQYMGQKKVAVSKYGTMVGKGHVSFLGGDKICLGSTYEREFESDVLDKEYAEAEIRSRIEPWYESLEDVKNKEFVCGVRVGQNDSYLPLVGKINEDTYVFTGLGSRGLLYHAYYGKILSDLIRS
ncbi:MAG: tRNA 5-methylaminomethyl-2-thiouridine biosynthesis bifunctional protein MnmC [Chlamydiia bacterium]|nr:tRNA 5-methylaminomethyl-2-thiouridine biosynthesis bifunctional protein MnmC [Chlamydiia bacterium]